MQFLFLSSLPFMRSPFLLHPPFCCHYHSLPSPSSPTFPILPSANFALCPSLPIQFLHYLTSVLACPPPLLFLLSSFLASSSPNISLRFLPLVLVLVHSSHASLLSGFSFSFYVLAPPFQFIIFIPPFTVIFSPLSFCFFCMFFFSFSFLFLRRLSTSPLTPHHHHL